MAAEGGAAHLALARELARRFGALAEVRAVAAGGSVATGAAGPGSDLDLYVFTAGEPPLAARRAMVAALGDGGRVELDLRYWDPGDAWFSAAGVEVDVVYWDARWIGEQLERVLTRHEPSVGYSTCHWRTLRHMLPLFDRDGWLARLQARAQAPYPQALADAIIARNHPLLRDAIPCYRAQIAKALARGDDVSVNHRVAALLASYFDVLFALNRSCIPAKSGWWPLRRRNVSGCRRSCRGCGRGVGRECCGRECCGRERAGRSGVAGRHRRAGRRARCAAAGRGVRSAHGPARAVIDGGRRSVLIAAR